MQKHLKGIYILFCSILFDPVQLYHKWLGLPAYFKDLVSYLKLNADPGFAFKLKNALPVLHDRFEQAGAARGHYFHQDIWAAKRIFASGVKEHVDAGSRLDGFVAHILPFCKVIYMDIRPLNISLAGLESRTGSILAMPFEDGSVRSLSCLHVLEHVGLGRYGDPVFPGGCVKAASELCRVLAPGGILLLGVPVGKERLCFNAHRIFDPQTIMNMFATLNLREFSLIDDEGAGIAQDASFEQARACDFGCGLFAFEK